jgi:hypothetical protein
VDKTKKQVLPLVVFQIVLLRSNYSIKKLLGNNSSAMYHTGMQMQPHSLTSLNREGNFNTHGVGYNAISGLSYDGHGISYETGEKHEPLHAFSASSKESIHLNLLTLALEGDKNALLFFNATATKDQSLFGTSNPLKVVLMILERKIASYEVHAISHF